MEWCFLRTETMERKWGKCMLERSMSGNESTGEGGWPRQLWRCSGGLKRVGNGDGCKQWLRIPNGTGLRAVSGQAPRAGQGLHCIRALPVFRDYRRKFWISDEEFWLNNEQGRIRSEPCFLDLISSFCLKKKEKSKNYQDCIGNHKL